MSQVPVWVLHFDFMSLTCPQQRCTATLAVLMWSQLPDKPHRYLFHETRGHLMTLKSPACTGWRLYFLCKTFRAFKCLILLLLLLFYKVLQTLMMQKYYYFNVQTTIQAPGLVLVASSASCKLAKHEKEKTAQSTSVQRREHLASF